MSTHPCACGNPVPCYSSTPCTNLAVPPVVQPPLGAQRIVNCDALLKKLLEEGGAVVNAVSVSAAELAEAQAEGRVFYGSSGVGFVLMECDWLKRVRHLEALYPDVD